MPDRADYLAKTLLARMRSLEGVMADGGDGADADKARRRLELVEKILAIDAGVVDGAKNRAVLAALPTLHPKRATSEKEQAELAAFLRGQLELDK